MTPKTSVRAAVGGVLVVAAIVLFLISTGRIRGAHEDLAERAWLVKHAPARDYRVLELGERRPDRGAVAVWVSVPGHAEAFIDLRGSKQRVDAAGQSVTARIDSRYEPGTGSGYAADNTTESAFRTYLGAGWPALLGLFLVGVTWVARRSGRSTT